MAWDDFPKYIGAASAGLALVAGAWRLGLLVKQVHDHIAKFVEMQEEYRKMAKQLKILWQLQVKRGEVKAVQKQLATWKPSPRPTMYTTQVHREMEVSEAIREAFLPITAELRGLWLALKDRFDRYDMAAEIENLYGNWLIDHICLPFDIHDNECIALALQVAMEEDVK